MPDAEDESRSFVDQLTDRRARTPLTALALAAVTFLLSLLTNVLSDLVPRTWVGSAPGIVLLLGGFGVAIGAFVLLAWWYSRDRPRPARRRWLRPAALATAVVLLMGGVFTGARTLPRPGPCVDLRIASSFGAPGRALAAAYERSGRRVENRCVSVSFVRDEASGATLRRLVQGWNPGDGPFPDAWWPSSSTFVDLLRARLRDYGRDERTVIAGPAVPVARSPMVIAMPRRMAESIGWPAQESPTEPKGIGWPDIVGLADGPRGWAGRGHPEWGAFKLGKTNPELSPSGLSATLATVTATRHGTPDYSAASIRRADVRRTVRKVERAVVHYAPSSAPFLDNLWRADRSGRALEYASALWLDEQAVYAYNRREPHDPLVAIYPAEGMLAADHPLLPLKSPGLDAVHRAALADFADFAARGHGRAVLRSLGFRDAGGGLDRSRITEANGVLPDVPIRILPSPGPDAVRRVLGLWEEYRKPANVLVLLDGSGSMAGRGDTGTSLSRLDAAKIAISHALGRLDPEDRVGAWTIHASPPSAHRELSPVATLGPLGDRRRDLLNGRISALRASGGTPLNAAVGEAYDAVRKNARDDTINAVLVLSDGQNSGRSTPSLTTVTDRIAAAYRTDRTTGEQVRVFAVWYRRPQDPEVAPGNLSLRRMTAATGGVLVNATPRNVDSVLDEVISDF